MQNERIVSLCLICHQDFLAVEVDFSVIVWLFKDLVKFGLQIYFLPIEKHKDMPILCH